MSLLHLLIGLSSLFAASDSSDCSLRYFRRSLQDLERTSSTIVKVKVNATLRIYPSLAAVNTMCVLKGTAPEQLVVEGLNNSRLCSCCVEKGMELILFLNQGINERYTVIRQGMQPFHYSEQVIRSHLQLKSNECLSDQLPSPDLKQLGSIKVTPSSPTPTPSADVCGVPSCPPDMTQSTAPEGAFPWHAVLWLGKPGKKLCDGTLIHRRWLLTSAHCIKNVKPKQLLVGLGVRNQWLKKENGRQVSKVRSIRIHPRYHNRSSLYDLAILKLYPDRIKPTQFVQPVCLTRRNPTSNSTCVVISTTNEGLEQSQVTLASKQRQETNKRLTFCSGAVNPVKGSFFAKYDSSPLICRHSDGIWHQHGIASSDKGCKDSNYTIFSRLGYSKLSKWIKQTTRNDVMPR